MWSEYFDKKLQCRRWIFHRQRGQCCVISTSMEHCSQPPAVLLLPLFLLCKLLQHWLWMLLSGPDDPRNCPFHVGSRPHLVHGFLGPLKSILPVIWAKYLRISAARHLISFWPIKDLNPQPNAVPCITNWSPSRPQLLSDIGVFLYCLLGLLIATLAANQPASLMPAYMSKAAWASLSAFWKQLQYTVHYVRRVFDESQK